MNNIPEELVQDGIFYVEVDEESYKSIEVDASINYPSGTIKLEPEKVKDIGKATVLQFNNHKIIIVSNKDTKQSLNSFYLAFKTKII